MAGRIFLVGWYGTANLGDEAIKETVERAAVELGVAIVRYGTRDPRDTDPRAVRLRSRRFWRYLDSCRLADRVVLGGGGILKDEGLGPLAELLLTALVARAWRRPVALLSVGVGPFYSRTGRLLVRWIARLCAVRTVRDAESAACLAGLGIDEVVVCADPIFSREPPAGGSTNGRPRAVISVRPWFHMDASGGEERRTAFGRDLEQTVRALDEAGWQVDFVALRWPADARVATEVAEAAGIGQQGAEGPLSWESLEEAVARSDLVVAMRYHCVAAAARGGRRVVALAYEPKVSSLARELGLACVDVDDAERSAKLLGLVRAAIGSREGNGVPLARAGGLDALSERARLGLRLALLGSS